MSWIVNSAEPSRGFTLAELLVALVILGVIATFTIPKVLNGQQDERYKANAKEVAAMITGAYQAYQLDNSSVPTSVGSTDLIPYMNYVSKDTAGSIDRAYGGSTRSCDNSEPCLVLHNGGKLFFSDDQFGGTANTNGFWLLYDPDGVADTSSTNGPGKSVEFILYYNSRITTWGNALPNTQSNDLTWGPDPSRDPPWFSWD